MTRETGWRTRSRVFALNAAGSAFESHHELATVGAHGVATLAHAGRQFLFFSNDKDERTTQQESELFEWRGGRYASVQKIATDGAHAAELFSATDGKAYLAVANLGDRATNKYRTYGAKLRSGRGDAVGPGRGDVDPGRGDAAGLGRGNASQTPDRGDASDPGIAAPPRPRRGWVAATTWSKRRRRRPRLRALRARRDRRETPAPRPETTDAWRHGLPRVRHRCGDVSRGLERAGRRAGRRRRVDDLARRATGEGRS